MPIHESVVNLLVNLGYTKAEGCCHGFSIRWLEACLLDEEDLFDARIKKIVSGGEDLVHSIHAVKEKKGQHLTAQDKELLDILAFYESLELYHFPHVHAPLFNASLVQNNVDIISNIASSAAILSRGGLARIYSEPGIYTKKEIKAYFDGLGVAIEKASIQSKEPLGIVLSSYNHAIALTYTPGKGWKFMDINQYPSKSFKVNETNRLAECIMTGFMQSNSSGSYSAFNASLFTTGKQVRLLNLKGPFASLQKSHSLTKEIANRQAGGIGLARIAAQYNHAPVIADLFKQGVDLNKADKEGITPVYIAAQNGNISVIVKLAQLKVNLNQAISDGLTPVFIAAQNGHVLVIAELAKYGVGLNQTLSNGITLAHVAAQEGHAVVIAELAKHKVNLNKSTIDGITPAYIAAYFGHAFVIAELAKLGVDLNQSISNGTPLAYIAAQNGHASVIATLAKYGVDLNQVDVDGSTPAYIAAYFGHAFVIAELAKYGVDLSQVKSTGETLAYIAAQQGHTAVIAELAKYGVNLNQAISQGLTPAIIAVQEGHASVIAELAKHKVDFNQATSDGATLAFIAAQNGFALVIAELIKNDVNFNTPYTASVDNLREFANSRGEEVIERMNDYIDQQLALSPTRQIISMTPYHIAMVMGHRAIAQTIKEVQAQKERLKTSHQLMEQSQDGLNKTIGDGCTFFASSVTANGMQYESNVPIIPMDI